MRKKLISLTEFIHFFEGGGRVGCDKYGKGPRLDRIVYGYLALVLVVLATSCALPATALPEEVQSSLPTDTPVSTETSPPEQDTDTGSLAVEEHPTFTPNLTPEPSPSPTATPTITLTPTPTQLAFVFEELAFFGGIPTELTACVVAAETVFNGNPMLYYAGPEVIHEGSVSLCLLGFPLGSQLSIELINPEGNKVDQLDFVQEDTHSLVDIIDIPLNIGLDIARGEWNVVLDRIVIIGRNPPEVKPKEISFIVRPGDTPAMSLRREFSGRVLSPAAKERVETLVAGENVILLGDKFTPGMQVPVGLYRQSLESLTPVYSVILTIDEKGRFEHKFQLPIDLERSWYRLIAFTNPAKPDLFSEQVLKSIFITNNP